MNKETAIPEIENRQKGAIAYLGPVGTFTEQAAFVLQEQYPNRIEANRIADIGTSIQAGEIGCGIVPIENSTAGPVADTMNLVTNGDFQIIQELHLPIFHKLYVPKGTALSEVTVVASKDQALMQCERYLDKTLPQATQQYTDSTAQAVLMAAQTSYMAAVGPSHTAEVLGVQDKFDCVEGIQDNDLNGTTFVVIQKRQDELPARTGNDKTSFIMTIPDREGSLFEILELFSENGVNLSKIKSVKTQDGTVAFFVSIEGHEHDEPVGNILRKLTAECPVKKLGSYPKAPELYAPSEEDVDMQTATNKVKQEAQSGKFDPHNKSVAIFTVKDQPGSLAYALKAFKDYNINLSHIDSLPSGRVGIYIFYLAFENNIPNEQKELLMGSLEEQCLQLVLMETAQH